MLGTKAEVELKSYYIEFNGLENEFYRNMYM